MTVSDRTTMHGLTSSEARVSEARESELRVERAACRIESGAESKLRSGRVARSERAGKI